MRYNKMEHEQDALEKLGWKRVSKYRMLTEIAHKYIGFVRYIKGKKNHEEVIDINYTPNENIQTFYNDGCSSRVLSHDELLALAEIIKETKSKDDHFQDQHGNGSNGDQRQ